MTPRDHRNHDTHISPGGCRTVRQSGRILAGQRLAGLTLVGLTLGLSAAEAQVSRVSVTATNAEANGGSRLVSVSGDGRYVAFVSSASNLVANDTNGADDVFVKDQQTGSVVRASVAGNGDQAGAASGQPSLSADGTLVAFTSLAALVPEDTNVCANGSTACEDVYIRDLVNGTTSLISVAPGGTTAMRGRGAKISGNGRFVAFSSPAAEPDGTPGVRLFIRDRTTGSTAQLTVANAQAASDVIVGGLSADGQVIAFGANQRVLPLDTEAECDKPEGCIRPYIHTRADGQTLRLNARSPTSPHTASRRRRSASRRTAAWCSSPRRATAPSPTSRRRCTSTIASRRGAAYCPPSCPAACSPACPPP